MRGTFSLIGATVLGLLVLVLLTPSPGNRTHAADQRVDGVSGVIHFRDGRQVAFLYTGDLGKVVECSIVGYLGKQRVEYKLAEIAEIHFANSEALYRNPGTVRDEAIVVSRSGERFSLSGVEIQPDNGSVRYVYLDPVTKQRRASRSGCRAISHITMGSDVGKLKRNPETGEFFPSIYNFDPFTGARLEWANRGPE